MNESLSTKIREALKSRKKHDCTDIKELCQPIHLETVELLLVGFWSYVTVVGCDFTLHYSSVVIPSELYLVLLLISSRLVLAIAF